MQIMVSFISATTINSWAEANPRRAQEILPELVIRLILATSTKIKDFNFPIEKIASVPVPVCVAIVGPSGVKISFFRRRN